MNPATDAGNPDLEIVLSRSFAAPRALVWAAWTDPDQVGLWWGPDGFTTTTHRIDVRPGGMWVYDMHGPDGTLYPNWIRYVEIDAPRRLVYDHGGGKGHDDVRFRSIITFDEADGLTTVRMRSIFPSKEARDAVVERYGAIEGGRQHLARLEAHAAAPPVTFATSRLIPASVEAIFAAIGQAERLARWWGPAGFTNTFTACSFTVKGRWSLIMHGPDGRDYPNENVFAEIEAPHRVVIEHVGAPRFRLAIALTPTAGGTLVSWRQTFLDPDVARRIEHIVVPANEQNLDRLSAEVLSAPAP